MKNQNIREFEMWTEFCPCCKKKSTHTKYIRESNLIKGRMISTNLCMLCNGEWDNL